MDAPQLQMLALQTVCKNRLHLYYTLSFFSPAFTSRVGRRACGLCEVEKKHFKALDGFRGFRQPLAGQFVIFVGEKFGQNDIFYLYVFVFVMI